jgi:excisionase family DNA binding protein
MSGRRPALEGLKPILLRVRDAAALMGISERLVWLLIRTKQLPVVRPPGMRVVRIARADVEALISSWQRGDQ